jgi:ankyrin repeat protein
MSFSGLALRRSPEKAPSTTLDGLFGHNFQSISGVIPPTFHSVSFALILEPAMRLLQIKDSGELSLVECVGTVPPYAILSHTWGPSYDEVSYQDMMNGTAMHKPAYGKFTFCMEQATKDNLAYFWIDTCCIDKSSSAELSESITSMFRWYQISSRCYVYLQDVSTRKRKADFELHTSAWESAFRTSRWFTRGWTLQELLAPSTVVFYSTEGELLGDKSRLEQVIHEITNIPISAIRGRPLHEFEVKERMSWTKRRHTTREEDGAYCLLGIFGISMSAIYGEGREGALRRLNREIEEARKRTDREIQEAYKRLESEVRDDTAAEHFPLSKDEKAILLKSLQFDQIDARYMDIKEAHGRTCKWILSSPTYLRWHDETRLGDHHGLLWIKGKPGTGKSTLMKSIMASVRETMKDSTVVSFFFNARGQELEKSTLGMYRSLLFQLLVRYPSTQKVLDTLGLANTNFTTHAWTIESLKTLMKQAIRGLGSSSLVCFVDALDECDVEQIRDMIQFFESIGDLSVSEHIRFQICCSSRYYPHISVRKGLHLQLERQEGHIVDITNYVATELRIDSNSGSAENIRAEIRQKASGIFMWVVLVVAILNKESDAGRVHTLQRRIRELPSDLHKLFRDIITRDSNYKGELLLCIQWVLFARYPLNPEQLYFAVLSATEPSAAFDWNPQEITRDTIERFILNSSKGLLAIATSPLRRVHFIHESVRDFLLKEDELSDIWPELGSNLSGHSHERLKHCCLMYMTMNFPTVAMMLEDANDFEIREDGLCYDVGELFPFLQYAVQCVLYHANVAEEMGVTQKELIEAFPLPQWVQLNNMYRITSHKHAEHATLAYILAELDMASLIKIHPAASYCLDIETERYGCPLFAAIANGSHQATGSFIEAMESTEILKNPFFKLSRDDLSSNNVRYHSQHNFAYSSAKGLFWCAAALGGEALVTHLARLNRFDTASTDMEGRTPLWWATRYGWEKAAKLLLDNTKATIIDIQDKDAYSPLHIAVQRMNRSMLELLIKCGANVNVQGGFYGHPLLAAARGGNIEIVTMLLDAGADGNSTSDSYGNALHAAAYGGHKKVVTLLLDRGADIKAQGPWGTVYMAALRRGHEDVNTLLRKFQARKQAGWA